jgi:hypothetical protein
MALEMSGKQKSNCSNISRTTIALQQNTKERLNHNRAPGQCYDGFISELVNYWERYRIGSSLCSPGRPVHRDAEL